MASSSYRSAFWRLASVALATTLVSFVGAGCHREQHPKPRPRITACQLLSRADVEAAFGAPVQPPTATADAGGDVLAGRSGCAWTTVDGSKALLVELVRTSDMSSTVRRTGFSAGARFQSAKSRHPTAVPIADVGDEALWVDEAATLHVLVDASYLTFEVAVPTPAAAQSTAITFAHAATANLAKQAD